MQLGNEGNYGLGGDAELAGEGLGAVGENAFDVLANEEPVEEGATERRVADVIAGEGALGMRLEGVFVDPKAVGAEDLLIDETVRWFPCRDPGSPGNGEAVDANAVIDEGPDAHFDGLRGDDVEIDPRRREDLKIGGIGKKGEDLLQRLGEDLLGGEVEGFHGMVGRVIPIYLNLGLARIPTNELFPARVTARLRDALGRGDAQREPLSAAD